MLRRTALLRIAAGLIGIVAIAMAAATLPETVEFGGTGSSGWGTGDGSGSGPEPVEPEDPATTGSIPAFLEYLVFALVVLVGLVLAWYLVFHRRKLAKLLALTLFLGTFFVALAWILFEYADPRLLAELMGAVEPPAESNETGGGGAPGENGGDVRPMPVEALVVLLAVLTAIFSGAIVLSGREHSPDDLGDRSTVVEDETSALGAAAGRAADRIESTDDTTSVDNEVYRAWLEMTGHLEVDRPETSTPGEFTTAAVDAGLSREDVEELTRLFEAVRYGGTETTPEMERRAVTILRRIESTYADDGGSRSRSGSDGDRR